MRVAFVTEIWKPAVNGVVTRLEATIVELRRRGHQVLVVAPSDSRCSIAGVDVVGSPSFRLPFLYGGQPWGLPHPRLTRSLEGFRPDLIHAVNPVLLGWAGIRFARSRRVPLVCSYHTHVLRYMRFYHLGAIESIGAMVIRRAHRLADLNLVTSTSSAPLLEGWSLPRPKLWRGAVDPRRYTAAPFQPDMRARLTAGRPGRHLVLYVGRLAAEKGIERLRVLARGDRHLALVGDGPNRAQLEAAFAGLQVTFAGWLDGPDVAAAYASADVFVFPSTTDTLGLAVLEARAAGLPVVASRSEASAALLEGATAATLVDPNDGQGLVAAVDELLAGAPPREFIAAEARQATSTWAQATDDLLAGYEEARKRTRIR